MKESWDVRLEKDSTNIEINQACESDIFFGYLYSVDPFEIMMIQALLKYIHDLDQIFIFIYYVHTINIVHLKVL